jgi:hypothetical protein
MKPAKTVSAHNFASSMAWDKKGTALLAYWFKKAFKVDAKPVTNTAVQKRGIDLCVKVPGRTGRQGPVGVDLKADCYTSGNITLELISQDRANTQRTSPAIGWTRKDMSLVAYLFVKTGEVIFINMEEAHAWLDPLVQALCTNPAEAPLDFHGMDIVGAPNGSYLSYNLRMPIDTLLARCPGTLRIQLCDLMERDVYEHLLDAPLCPPMSKQGASSNAMTVLQDWLLKLPCYHAKEDLDETQKELLLRWLEPRALFKGTFREKGEALQMSRPRLKVHGEQ